MKKLILCRALFIFGFYPILAQNLVPNPGFEAYKRLPCNFLNHKIFELLEDWTQPTPASTDYFNSLSKDTCKLDPAIFGVSPRTGHGMVGLFTYSYVQEAEDNHPFVQENAREYIEVRLKNPLTPSKFYYIEFYTLSESSVPLVSNNLGAYFSDTLFFLFDDPLSREILNVDPQIVEKEIIRPADGWTRVSGCFLADSKRAYLIIGNFLNDVSTEIEVINKLASVDNVAYYYIDDVSVIELPYNVSPLQRQVTYCNTRDSLVLDAFVKGATGYQWENGSESSSLTVTDKIDGDYRVDIFFKEGTYTHTFTVNYVPDIDLGPDTVLCRGEEFLLAPEYSEGGYQWYDRTSDLAKLITKPGDYWVNVPSFCAVRDTIRVDFIDCPGFVPNAFTPNGDSYNQKFRIPNIRGRGWTLAVFNRWGKQVYFSTNYKNDWEGEGLSEGVYYYTLSQSELNRNLKGYVQLLK